MEQADVVRHTLAVLHRMDLKYAVVGSFASIAFGEPRYARDIDILIDLPHGLTRTAGRVTRLYSGVVDLVV